jgi:hypothetical protein
MQAALMSDLDADINPCVCAPLRKFHLGEYPAIWRRTISDRRLQLRTRLRCYRRHRPSLRLFPRDASGYRLRGIASSAFYQTSVLGHGPPHHRLHRHRTGLQFAHPSCRARLVLRTTRWLSHRHSHRLRYNRQSLHRMLSAGYYSTRQWDACRGCLFLRPRIASKRI